MYLQYDFSERGCERIFLKCAIFREFEPGSDDIVSAKSFVFEEDGQIHIEDRDLRSETTLEKDTWASPDVNWEYYPSFGEYDGICRAERVLPSSPT